MTAPQGKKWGSIQSRLILLFLFILIPVLAIQAFMYYESYQARLESEHQANLEIARAVAKTFESFVQDVLHQELAIGLALTSSQPMKSKDIARLLATCQDYTSIRDFTWMNPDGVATYSSNPAMVGRNYSDRAYFRDIANGPDWTVGELVLARTTGDAVFGISRGIRDDKGALLGVVVATVVPENLDAVLAVERRKGGGHALIDGRGMLVYRYPAINTTWEERNWLKQYPGLQETLKGKELASSSVFASFEGKNRLASSTPVSSMGWAVTAGITEEEVTGPILISIANNALLFLSVLLAAFFIALAVSRKITSPIQALRTHALALGRGRLETIDIASGPGEIIELANAFNEMSGEVRLREEALRESRALLQAITDGIPVGVFLKDRQSRIIMANPATLAIIGKSAEQVIGMDDMEHYADPAVGQAIMENDRRVMDSGQTEVIEETALTSEGYRTYQSAKTPFRDGKGNVVGVLGICHDITERKRMEEALRKEKDDLEERVKERTYELYAESIYARSLIEAGLDPLVTISVDGKIMDANRASEDATGIPREQLIGSDFSDNFTDPKKARAGYEQVFRQGFVRDYPLELKHRDGHVTPVLYNASVYRDDAGRDMGVFAAARDITERKQAEAALRKLASELAMAEERERKRIAGVLHDDIAQTLAAARIRLDLLQALPTDPRDRQIVQEVKEFLVQSIRDTRALMTDIGNPLLFDLGLKAACEALAKRLMDTHSVRIRCDIGDAYKHLDPDVKTILYQVVRELLANVVKHSRAQNARVMIHTENGHIRVQVEDDGAGYDPQTLGAPTVEGGFGLYSIRERLLAMEGSLQIESSPGTGTVVTAIFPVALD